MLLLSYLAVEGAKEKWLVRELFWRDAKSPQNSLATAVAYLRKASPGLVGTDDASVWCEVECDAAQLLMALESRENDKAAELYQGPFLAGVDPSAGGVELEEWIYATRELLGIRARRALLDLAEDHASVGEFSSGAELAMRAYLLPGAPEPEPEDFERMFVLLQAGEHPGGAEVRKEAAGFDLELSLSSEGARAALQQREGTTKGGAQVNLPVQATRFVGRERELRDVSTLLTNPDHRLLTIVGPGGIGKTRLALEAAARLASAFEDGAWFVPFDSVNAPEFMASAIADALGVARSGRQDPHDQLLDYLVGREMLVVMDNLEHVLDGTSLIAEMLQAAPKLRILATSRERLGLRAEVVLDLAGMALPDPEEGDPESTDAVRLFVQAGRIARADFTLKGNVSAVADVCRRVGGMPLALELAASWLRVLSAAEIAEELERGTDLLHSTFRDTPERHRDMQTVFDASWLRLSAREQHALRTLSVFRAGFSREAAADVAGVSLPLLLVLCNRSFVRREPSGRFTQHPLLWQYLRDRATEEAEAFAQTQEEHAAYFTDLMHVQQSLHQGMEAKSVRAALEHDLANIREAWVWAADRGRESFLDRALETLTELHFQTGRYREGEALLAYAAEKLQSRSVVHGRLLRNMGRAHLWGHHDEAAAAALERSILIFRKHEAKRDEALALRELTRIYESSPRWGHDIEALWRRCAGLFRELGDRYNEARILANAALYSRDLPDREGLLRDSIRLHREVEGYGGITLSLTNLAICVAQSYGAYRQAHEHLREAVGIERARGVGARLAIWLNWQGNVLVYQGDDAAAESHYLEAREISEALEPGFGEGELDHALLGLGRLALRRGDLEGATGLLSEALASNRRHPDRFGLRTEIYRALADVAIGRGRFSDAEELSREALRYFHERRQDTFEGAWTESLCHHQLAVIALVTDDVSAAQDHLCKALALAREWHLLPATLHLVIAFAKMVRRGGNVQRAASLLTVVANHPASMSTSAQEARRELEAFPEELVEAGPMRPQLSTPEAIAEELLADLCPGPQSG